MRMTLLKVMKAKKDTKVSKHNLLTNFRRTCWRTCFGTKLSLSTKYVMNKLLIFLKYLRAQILKSKNAYELEGLYKEFKPYLSTICWRSSAKLAEEVMHNLIMSFGTNLGTKLLDGLIVQKYFFILYFV